MPNVTEKDYQGVVECLPDPLTIQIALLRKWCVDHNWRDCIELALNYLKIAPIVSSTPIFQ